MMLDPFSYWTRVVSSMRMMEATGRRIAQTAEASGAVIAARTETMRDVTRTPLSADYAELGRMVPEKLAAFTQSGNAVMGACLEAQAAWWSQAQATGRMMTRGRLPTPVEMAEMWSSAALEGLRAMEAGSRAGRDAIAPIHAAATGNAKRLKAKSAR